jgi:hypothetical protein
MLREFGSRSFIVRWLATLLLVLGTYNPYASSYYHWVVNDPDHLSLKVMVGVALLILHVVVLVATVRSVGPIGMTLLTALFAAFAWVLADNHAIEVENPKVFVTTILVIAASVYGVGVSWSHVRNRLSGQVDSTDVTAQSPL